MKCDIVCGLQDIHGDLHWTVDAKVSIDESLQSYCVAIEYGWSLMNISI